MTLLYRTHTRPLKGLNFLKSLVDSIKGWINFMCHNFLEFTEDKAETLVTVVGPLWQETYSH